MSRLILNIPDIVKRTMIVMSVFFAVSCARPDCREFYVGSRNTDTCGRYVFEADMSDSAALYNMWFYAVLDCDDVNYRNFDSLGMHILWVSPTGLLYEDYLQIDRDNKIGGSFYEKDFRMPYRQKMRMKECGKWQLKVSICDSASYCSSSDRTGKRKSLYDICGIGLRVAAE